MTSKAARSCLDLARQAGVISIWRGAREHFVHPAEVVYYHRIKGRSCVSAHPPFLAPIDVDRFEDHIEFFASSYELVPLSLLAQCLREGKPWPRRALAITFDDGYKDNYEHAFPVLKKHRAPATIFLTAGNIDEQQTLWWDSLHRTILNHHIWASASDLPPTIYPPQLHERWSTYDPSSTTSCAKISADLVNRLKMVPDDVRMAVLADLPKRLGVDSGEMAAEDALLTWDEIREMASDGIAFGAHTLTHPSLDQVDLQRLRREVEGSKLLIEDKLARRISLFAYPGGSGSSRDSVREVMLKAGFTGAVTNRPGSNTACADSFTISRRPVPDEAVPVVSAGMVGFFTAWGRLRSVARR